MLKLRERALKEKTRAELAWLDQQKQQMRDKGKDDMYPAINKKKRGLKMRFQQEQVGDYQILLPISNMHKLSVNTVISN